MSFADYFKEVFYKRLFQPQLPATRPRNRADSLLKVFEILDERSKNGQDFFRIVETGTARADHGHLCFGGDGCCTYIFDKFVNHYDGEVLSVDINEKNCRYSTSITSQKTVLYHQDSVEMLWSMPEADKVDLLYLDTIDFDPENPYPSMSQCMKELCAAMKNLRPESIVIIDSHDPLFTGGKMCKSLYVKNFMSDIKADLLFEDYQIGWIFESDDTNIDEKDTSTNKNVDMSVMTETRHAAAQEYEWAATVDWVGHALPTLNHWVEERNDTEYWCGESGEMANLNQFFLNDEDVWLKFAKEIQDKTLLEIGGACFGTVARWSFIKTRIHIEPLLPKINPFLEKALQGRDSWYKDVIEYPVCAEEFISELEDRIDGCIYTRNCLDHTKNPWAILDNIGRYAKKGCYLLLWTEIAHLDGGDVGHIDITHNPEDLESYIKNLGFEIIRPVVVGNLEHTLEYGCFAIKNE